MKKTRIGRFLYSNCQGIDSMGKNLGAPHITKSFSGDIFYNLIREQLTIPWPSFIARHNAIISVGSFRDFKHAEDKDILLRLAHRYKFGYINKILSNYRIHPQQLSINFDVSLRETIQISKFWKEKLTNDQIIQNNHFKIVSNAYYKAAIYSLYSETTKQQLLSLIFKSIKNKVRLNNIFLLVISFLPNKSIRIIYLF